MSDLDLCTPANLSSQLASTHAISPFENSFRVQAQHKIDNKTKPLGSLGTLESLAVKMCCIQNILSPQRQDWSSLSVNLTMVFFVKNVFHGQS